MTLHDELRFLRDLGYTHLDLSRPVTAAEAVLPEAPVAHEAVQIAGAAAQADDTGWGELETRVMSCDACKLAQGRTNVVFGTGNPNARLMFIGEAPGRDEDLAGKPFVGRAGQLLTDIIKAMKLTRDDVYIANVIKCRPPENRNPEPDELEACRPFIRQQVDMIKPEVIVTLGKFALQSLLEQSRSISASRGQWLEYRGVKVMPTFHPAYLLRTPSAKKEVWADMKKVMAELGIAVG